MYKKAKLNLQTVNTGQSVPPIKPKTVVSGSA